VFLPAFLPAFLPVFLADRQTDFEIFACIYCSAEGRNTSRDRQRYRKTDIQIYIQTSRNKDVQTYTDKQTDRRTVQKYWYRLKNKQMYRKTKTAYGTYLQYCT